MVNVIDIRVGEGRSFFDPQIIGSGHNRRCFKKPTDRLIGSGQSRMGNSNGVGYTSHTVKNRTTTINQRKGQHTGCWSSCTTLNLNLKGILSTRSQGRYGPRRRGQIELLSKRREGGPVASNGQGC